MAELFEGERKFDRIVGLTVFVATLVGCVVIDKPPPSPYAVATLTLIEACDGFSGARDAITQLMTAGHQLTPQQLIRFDNLRAAVNPVCLAPSPSDPADAATVAAATTKAMAIYNQQHGS
jgi:hypothetical protein